MAVICVASYTLVFRGLWNGLSGCRVRVRLDLNISDCSENAWFLLPTLVKRYKICWCSKTFLFICCDSFYEKIKFPRNFSYSLTYFAHSRLFVWLTKSRSQTYPVHPMGIYLATFAISCIWTILCNEHVDQYDYIIWVSPCSELDQRQRYSSHRGPGVQWTYSADTNNWESMGGRARWGDLLFPN